MDRKVWDRIKYDRDFDLDPLLKGDLIQMVEENIDRFEFVTDCINLRDVIFVTEKGCDGFDHEIFGAYDVDVDFSKDYLYNMRQLERKKLINPWKALSGLKNVLETTKRTIGLAIGLFESSTFDFAEISVRAKEDKKHIALVMKELREFPDWYKEVAKDPLELVFIPNKAEEFIATILTEEQRQELSQEINRFVVDISDEHRKNQLLDLSKEIQKYT